MGSVKQPYCFEVGDRELFAFAGLWDEWTSPDGEVIESCTILTTGPNSLVEDLHNRMPVIVAPDISNNVGSVKSFFERTSPFTPVSGLPGYLRPLHRRPRLVRNLSIGFSPTQTSLRSVLRPRLLIQTPFAGSGMPNQVDGVLLHTMSGTELSHVRTAL